MSKNYVLIDQERFNSMIRKKPTIEDYLKKEHDKILFSKSKDKSLQNRLYNASLSNYLKMRPINALQPQHVPQPIFSQNPDPPMPLQEQPFIESLYSPRQTVSDMSVVSPPQFSPPSPSFSELTDSTQSSTSEPRKKRNKTIIKSKKVGNAEELAKHLKATSSRISKSGRVLNLENKPIKNSDVNKSALKLVTKSPSIMEPPGHAVVKKIVSQDPNALKFVSPRNWKM